MQFIFSRITSELGKPQVLGRVWHHATKVNERGADSLITSALVIGTGKRIIERLREIAMGRKHEENEKRIENENKGTLHRRQVWDVRSLNSQQHCVSRRLFCTLQLSSLCLFRRKKNQTPISILEKVSKTRRN